MKSESEGGGGVGGVETTGINTRLPTLMELEHSVYFMNRRFLSYLNKADARLVKACHVFSRITGGCVENVAVDRTRHSKRLRPHSRSREFISMVSDSSGRYGIRIVKGQHKHNLPRQKEKLRDVAEDRQELRSPLVSSSINNTRDT
ncbi:unnamed protein product, partial [Pleuronectes platessa]